MRNDIRPSLVSILSLLTACGSSDPIPGGTLPAPSSSAMPDPTSTGTPAPSSSGAPEAPCRAGFICDVQGMPFVRAALPSADSLGAPGDPPPGPGMTQVTIRQPEPGKMCMSGRVENGWAWLTLAFADWGASGWSGELDAPGLGIERFEFTLESAPAVGVNVQLVSGVPNCTSSPTDCQHWGFLLNTGEPRTPFVTHQDGLVSAPIADFIRNYDINATWQYAPNELTTLQIGPGALGSVTGELDFCVSQLRFLDAQGAEVLPTR